MDESSMLKIFYKLSYPFVALYWKFFASRTDSAKCIIICGQEVLLVKNVYGKGWWNLPGGGIEKGETPAEAAVREVREEVGITDLSDPRLVKEMDGRGEGRRGRIYCFVAWVKKMDFNKNSLEIVAAGWFPLRVLPVNLSPVAKEALEYYRKGSSE